MKYTVELDDVSASEIVRQTLIDDYKIINDLFYLDEQELLNSLDRVIKYHSTRAAYEEWKSSLQQKD